jgi:hypothetical protein
MNYLWSLFLLYLSLVILVLISIFAR